MKLGWLLGIVAALFLHAGFLLFGGLIVGTRNDVEGATQEVELLSDVDAEEKKPDEPAPETPEELKTEAETPPDAAEIMKSLETPAPESAPALEAASLSAIEAALNGQAGGGDFAEGLSFASGGRIGGTGKAGGTDEKLDEAFSLAEIDQKPRAVFQTAPMYPSAMRGKKVEGVVTVIFVVDENGKVSNPRVEKSSNEAFEQPALSAVKKWKFEPGVRGGARVACRMRIPIRFPPN